MNLRSLLMWVVSYVGTVITVGNYTDGPTVGPADKQNSNIQPSLQTSPHAKIRQSLESGLPNATRPLSNVMTIPKENEVFLGMATSKRYFDRLKNFPRIEVETPEWFRQYLNEELKFGYKVFESKAIYLIRPVLDTPKVTFNLCPTFHVLSRRLDGCVLNPARDCLRATREGGPDACLQCRNKVRLKILSTKCIPIEDGCWSIGHGTFCMGDYNPKTSISIDVHRF